MKRALTIAAIATALLAAPAMGEETGEELRQEIKTNCAAEWQTNYRMQQHCRLRYAAGALEFLEMMGGTVAAPPHVLEIGEQCLAEWPGPVVGRNWPMVAYCTRQQLEAYEALNR